MGKDKILKIFLATLLSLQLIILIEILLNIIGWPKQDHLWRIQGINQIDEDLIYSLKPNFHQIWGPKKYYTNVNTNSYGLRDTEIKATSELEKRIIVTGDELVFGQDVNMQMTFPNRLEVILNREGHDADVINAGVGGYGTDQTHQLFFSRLRYLDPDMLIFSINDNDIADNINHPLYSIRKENLVPVGAKNNWVYRIGILDRYMPKAISEMKLYRIVLRNFSVYNFFLSANRENRPKLIDWSVRKVFLQLRSLKLLCDKENIDFFLIFHPSKKAKIFRYRQIVELARKLNIPYVEFGAGNEEDIDNLFHEQRPFYTEEGHKIIARKTHDLIKQSL